MKKHTKCGRFTLYVMVPVTLGLIIVPLHFLGLFAPTRLVTMVTITTSSALYSPNSPVNDGPSLDLGLLGSCFRQNNTANRICTAYSVVTPRYHIAGLPNTIANKMLTPPPAFISFFIFIVICFIITFAAGYTITAFRQRKGEFVGGWEKSRIQFYMAWVAAVGFVVGALCFLFVFIWFQKAIEDFNNIIVSQGGPSLIAAFAHGFIMMLAAYIFYAMILIITLAKWYLPAMETKGEIMAQETADAIDAGILENQKDYDAKLLGVEDKRSNLVLAEMYRLKEWAQGAKG